MESRLLKVMALDIDSMDNENTITYQILSDPSNLFRIDYKTGWIILAKNLPNSYKIGQELKLEIGSIDSAQQTSSNKATVYFKIINNNILFPKHLLISSTNVIEIPENQPFNYKDSEFNNVVIFRLYSYQCLTVLEFYQIF